MEYGNGAIFAADESAPEGSGSYGRSARLIRGSIYRTVGKRLMDALLSSVGIVLLSPLCLAIAAVVRLESHGPAIYRQERLGLGGRRFMILKFRSMYQDAEINGPVWAEKDDRRVTRVGRFLRRTRLDELPQMFNILKGDMSIVGPRPERAYFYNKFEPDIPDFRSRLYVKPGLTGLAQVNGGYDITPARKLVYDKQYMRHITFFGDISIIFRTFRIIFTGDGSR